MNESSVINKPEEHATSEHREAQASVAQFRLQPDSQVDNASSYALADLLNYHDKTFVLNTYAAITKQPPSPAELMQVLQDLRNGQRTKIDIIEQLCTRYPNVRVTGLGTPTWRRITSWPGVGYVFRLLRAISRLPMLIQHQQQFESYITGQQQRLADHVNDLSLAMGSDLSMRQGELAENLSDAIKTVMMLSDSLIDLSANVAQGQTYLETLQAQHEKLEMEFRTSTQQLTASAQQIQKQHEQSETQLHSDLVALTTQITAQQEQLQELRRTIDATAAIHREFLIDEQRIIVEAQRAAISDVKEQVAQSAREDAAKIERLAADVQELRAVLQKVSQAGLRK
jgi:hypothetical protein